MQMGHGNHCFYVCALLLIAIALAIAAVKIAPIVLGLYWRGALDVAGHLKKTSCGFDSGVGAHACHTSPVRLFTARLSIGSSLASGRAVALGSTQ